MTTDKLPETKINPTMDAVSGPAQHSSAAEVIKNTSIEANSKGGRRLKFIPEGRNGKLSMIIGGVLGTLIILLLIVAMIGGGKTAKKQADQTSSPVVIKDLDTNNNSAGYIQSLPGSFGSYSLDLSATQPTLIKSASYEANLGEQITWDDGFAILAASVDRDYRPASEFDYKKVAEAGDELVRVNFLVGNASSANVPIGYRDLALYATTPDGANLESERISEDTYSPKDGQILGARQTQKISLHYRVKRGQEFSITKTKTFNQQAAKVKSGEEKTPTLSLKINL